MSEPEEPAYELQRGDEPWFMTRKTGALFTYFGRNAVHNHVMLLLDRDSGLTQHVWVEDGLYKPLSQFIIANSFTQHLNMEEVPRSLLAQHVADLSQDLKENNSVPKDWLRQ